MSGRRTHWGWHRLDDAWAERLVDDAGIRTRDLVLDVGAGAGALTRPLVRRGARVIAFELHPARAAQLRQRFADDRVTVVCADGADIRLPRQPFHVVANPPFAISVALLRRLTAPGSRLVRADVVVPWHVARRWVKGDPPAASRWRHEFSCRYGRPLQRSAFSPPPPSSVAVLVIERRTGPSRASMTRPAEPRPSGSNPSGENCGELTGEQPEPGRHACCEFVD